MTSQEEAYIHFVSCIDNLNTAWRILSDVAKSENNPLIGPAFQFALIEYSKPYKVSFGVAGNKARYKLDNKYIPEKYIELHAGILDARDQFHAHADLSIKEAKLDVVDASRGKFAVISQNIIYGTEELKNIDKIIELIEETLAGMYAEVDIMESLLPTTFPGS